MAGRRLMAVATPDIRHEESGATRLGRAAADRSIARSSDRAPAPARAVARNLAVGGRLPVHVVRWHPRTAEISRDFTALKLEPFLEPRAFCIWNRKQVATKKLY
jgi:hypothetical protein